MNLDGVAHTLPTSMGGSKTPFIDQKALDDGSKNWFCQYHKKLMDKTVSPEEESVPESIRRLTIKEAAALQTFPKDYVFHGRKTNQYKQIGNAVAADFAYALAESVKTVCFDN